MKTVQIWRINRSVSRDSDYFPLRSRKHRLATGEDIWISLVLSVTPLVTHLKWNVIITTFLVTSGESNPLLKWHIRLKVYTFVNEVNYQGPKQDKSEFLPLWQHRRISHPSFIHPFNKYLFRACSMSGTKGNSSDQNCTVSSRREKC
jgi:hypothetical protein